MRYGGGGGYTPDEQDRRERVRLEAAACFERNEPTAEVAVRLRVPVRRVQKWRKAWREGGVEALRSRGPVSRAALGRAVEPVGGRAHTRTAGPRVHRRPALDPEMDQAADRQDVPHQLHRAGGMEAAAQARLDLPGPRPPGRRAGRGRDRGVERAGVAAGKSTAADLGAHICFADEAGQALTSIRQGRESLTGRSVRPFRPSWSGVGPSRVAAAVLGFHCTEGRGCPPPWSWSGYWWWVRSGLGGR